MKFRELLEKKKEVDISIRVFGVDTDSEGFKQLTAFHDHMRRSYGGMKKEQLNSPDFLDREVPEQDLKMFRSFYDLYVKHN